MNNLVGGRCAPTARKETHGTTTRLASGVRAGIAGLVTMKPADLELETAGSNVNRNASAVARSQPVRLMDCSAL